MKENELDRNLRILKDNNDPPLRSKSIIDQNMEMYKGKRIGDSRGLVNTNFGLINVNEGVEIGLHLSNKKKNNSNDED